MMLKTLFSALIMICLSSIESHSQKLMHSFGANISILQGKITTSDPYSSSSFTLTQTNLSYFPRYNFVENENSSISIGLPIGVGIGIASNTYGNDAGVAFAYDLPVAFDYNIGCKSTSENEETFGGYFGVGFGYYKLSISHSQYSDFNGSSYGPILRAGVRIGSSNENWGDHGLTVGLFFKKGLEKARFNTFGFNVLYDL